MAYESIIKFVYRNDIRFSSIIRILTENKWQIWGRNGKIRVCLDSDYFEWQDIISERAFYNYADSNNVFGVTLFYDELIGVELMVTKEKEIVINPSINRVTILHDTKHTDFNWYMDNFIIPLEKEGIIIEDLILNEYIG